MSCPSSNENQPTNQELEPCNNNNTLITSVQRSPLCASSISTHRTELVLNLTTRSLKNNLNNNNNTNYNSSFDHQPQQQQQSQSTFIPGQVSHLSIHPTVNQPLSPQLVSETIQQNKVQYPHESLNYSPSSPPPPVAYESQTQTSHAALQLRPVICEDIKQPHSTQLTYSQISHIRPRGSIRFSSTFPIINQSSRSVSNNSNNSTGNLNIPSSSQFTVNCIPVNSSPGIASLLVSFKGNTNPQHHPSSSSLTIIQQSSPSSQASRYNPPTTTGQSETLSSSSSQSPPQVFTRLQSSFGPSEITSVVFPFLRFESSTMHGQISSPSSNSNRSQEVNLMPPERPTSVSPRLALEPPARPSVPCPRSRQVSVSSLSVGQQDYVSGKFFISISLSYRFKFF